MPNPQEPTDQELYLAQLNTSDEGIEELLSGGADVDDMIASGAVEIETEGWGWQVEGAFIEVEPTTMTENEVMAELREEQEWLKANGHAYRPYQMSKHGQLSNRPN